MKKPTNGELHIMIENLTKIVEEGFKTTHTKQDYTNGDVRKNTKFRWVITGIATFASVIGVSNIVQAIMK